MDPRVLMAELYGKHDGCCGGRGGTMHLYDAATGCSAPTAWSAAAFRPRSARPSAPSIGAPAGWPVAFFGDGATNHAAFHESLNFAGCAACARRPRL
jgi:2-oxoisovalerate dehydrogenase E1 component